MDDDHDPGQRGASLSAPVRPVDLEQTPAEPHTPDVRVSPDVDARSRLRRPLLTLQVESEDVVVVSGTFSTVYGTGDTLHDSIADYLRTLFDYVEKPEAREAQLARGLAQQLAILCRHVVRQR